MDSKKESELNQLVASDFYNKAQRIVHELWKEIETGEQRKQNPFSGEEVVVNPSPEGAILHQIAKEFGCDEQLKDAVQKFAHSLIFSFCAAFDGSGAFESQSQIQIAVDGEVLESYLLEIYFSQRGTE